MSSKRCNKVEDTLDDFDDSWEEEIERLKHEIKRAEKRIVLSEQGRWVENARFLRGCDRPDNDSVRSTMPADISSAPLVERIIRDRKLSANSVDSHLTARNHKKVTDVSGDKISKESVGENWASPHVSKARHTKRDIFSDQLGNCPESSLDFDCESSIVSLDFGLVSPRKNWCSPPQRIERAQNREWFSPHSVIDRPNPENSPGNWISVKESCAAPRHSPTLGVKNANVRSRILKSPEPESRPVSQSTYVVQEAPPPPEVHPKDNQPTRKISVLERFAPERIASTKKRIGDHGDAVERNLLPTKEKIRRVVNTSGHVVKISLLGDFEAPAFGRAHEKASETAETECRPPSSKVMKGITKKKRGIPSWSSPKVKRKKKERKAEGGIAAGLSSQPSFSLISNQSAEDAGIHLRKHHEKDETKEMGNESVNACKVDNVVSMENVENAENVENVEKVAKVEYVENVDKSMHKMMQNLEYILRPIKEDTDKTECVLAAETGIREEKPKPKKLKQEAFVVVEEKPLEPPEKRKRNVDPKAVREYIKNQKQKRMEQVKMEKETKDAEREARKKKLEELRLKTIKLASQSKKKKSPQPTADEVKAGTEDDVTMSLGLKQVIPKVSYNESISKLKKKTVHQKSQHAPSESQPSEGIPEVSESEENADDQSLLRQEIPGQEVNRTDDFCLKKPEESAELKTRSDLNVTLKKLAESLHLKIDQKEKEIRAKPASLPSKSSKVPPPPPSLVPSHEASRTVKSIPEENHQLITVDVETIKTLKSDIKRISENFKVLHEIIAEKGDVSGRGSLSTPRSTKPQCQDRSREFPDWLKSSMPRAYPYNVYGAFQKKMNLKTTKEPSSVSRGDRAFAEPYVSNKRDGEFERLSMPSDRLRPVKDILGSFRSTSFGTYEENYFSVKDDSGSEMSSSILDSEKQSLTSVEGNRRNFSNSSKPTGPKDSLSSSIITEITSRSFPLKESETSSKSSCDGVDGGRESLILITPDVKLISSDPHEEKVHGCANDLNLCQTVCEHISEELNDSEKSCREKTDSTAAEIMDNPSGSDTRAGQDQRSDGGEGRSCAQGGEAVHARRSFFQPEVLHLQFQAELNLIEKFQQSLSQFLEAEKSKASVESNKIVYEKAISTEELLDKEDRAVQAPHLREASGKTTSEETDSVATEINAVESIKTNQPESPKVEQDPVSELDERFSSSSKETLKGGKPQDLENSEMSSDLTEISLHTFNSTMKDEEVRSEHLLALIRLREKTLTEKVKAELTFLEMKKRMLKERSGGGVGGGGGDEEQNISAIKKKQRGILLKYQSEKEEIERLKKMHKVASEERKTVIKRQKQIQQMQISDGDMKIRLKKREKSPQKKAPLKPKALTFSGRLEVSENVPTVSDSLLSESVGSPDESKNTSRSDLDLSPRSNVSKSSEHSKADSSRTVNNKIFIDLENFKSKKSQLEVERYPWKQHSAEELIKWTKRLEERENHLKELEKQTVSAAVRVKSRLVRSLKNVKTSVKDRSTSPFQFQDAEKTASGVSPPDTAEVKKSSTISEEIDANPETEVTERTESVLEKFQSSASEDIPEQFSKKNLTSRTSEYQSENFESPSSSETAKNKPVVTRKCDRGNKGIAIKMSLSPRMQSSRRRYSSGSDESVNLSHTETASEQSDLESRIAALHEQLRKRKLEAERLRREQKKAQRERLKVKEQCLLNQIQAYDAYIQKKKQELEREYERSNQTVMKPLIKQPRVAEKRRVDSMTTTKSSEREKREPEAKAVERDESSRAEKAPDKESDSEVVEQIKIASDSIGEALDESESIREQIESKIEEGERFKGTESSFDAELSLKESLDEGKSTSVSDSVPGIGQDGPEGSQSESEDQSISVKTTLISPEKQDGDVIESLTVAEDASQTKQTTDEDFYRCDSFESDADEKSSGGSDIAQIKSEPSEAHGEVVSESAAVQVTWESEDGESNSREEQRDSEREGKSKRADQIADSIIMGLILESVNVFCNKKVEAEKKLAEQSRLSLEVLSSFLAREIISEAVEDVIGIYKKKARPEEERSARRITSEVRRRITEIAGGAKDPKRPREATLATRDASPPDEAAREGAEHGRFLQTASFFEGEERPEKQVFTERECNDPDSTGQEWIDDDFGLSQTRREAEELRLQQLQIEQEIQQLQAQQKQVPYFYLREIPNKPPPPYTPPAKPFTEIPASESEIMTITLEAVRILTDEMSNGKPVDVIEPDWEYYGDAPSENFRCYKFFLFDLAKHIISDLMAQQQERKAEVLPWMRTRKRLSKYKYQKIERTFECLNDFAQRQIFVLFGFGKKVSKESLIVRWIKKKRDHVDEILVGESQEEEAQWTRYDEDQVTVKNEVTTSILDSLLEDTAQVIGAICNNKMRKEKGNRFAVSQ